MKKDEVRTMPFLQLLNSERQLSPFRVWYFSDLRSEREISALGAHKVEYCCGMGIVAIYANIDGFI